MVLRVILRVEIFIGLIKNRVAQFKRKFLHIKRRKIMTEIEPPRCHSSVGIMQIHRKVFPAVKPRISTCKVIQIRNSAILFIRNILMNKMRKCLIFRIFRKIMCRKNSIIRRCYFPLIQPLRTQSHVLYRKIKPLANILSISSLQSSSAAHPIMIIECRSGTFHIVIFYILDSQYKE